MAKKLKLEIACYNIESAIIAERAGADRIELCASPIEGGITPSVGMIETCLNMVNIPINVMIRPRGGDFKYNPYELEAMKKDIVKCKELGVNGVVFGVLNVDAGLDVSATKELISAAGNIEKTLHRAFDMAKNLNDTLEKAINCGFDRILTSGERQTALEGKETIKELVKLANRRIIIMPGSGLRYSNFKELHKAVRAVEYHASCITKFESSMRFRNPNISMASGEQTNEYSLYGADFNSIYQLRSVIDEI